MRYLIAFFPVAALANGVVNPPPVNSTPVTQTQTQTVTAPATATANPVNTVTSSPVATANPVANGGAGGNASAGSATSSSGGNAQNTSFSVPRQAPAISQGSLAIVGCAAGVNAGGSGAGGASFLGFSWVTGECHGFALAQALLAIGDAKGACEVLHAQKAFKRAERRGAKLAACE